MSQSTDEIKYFKLDSYDVMEAYDAKWLKIFYHNSTGKVFFDKSEVKYKTNDPKKYSLLKLIPFIRRYDETYEFIIEYPELNGFNRWYQTINPLEGKPLMTNSEIGFHPISLKWAGEIFSGLSISDFTNYSYLDGSSNTSYWHYAIGAYYYFGAEDQFPGPRIGAGDNYSVYNVRQVFLYIRVKDFHHLFQYRHTCQCFHRFFQRPHIFLFLLLQGK